MKNKLRLILGRPVDAPFANSIPVLLVLAVLFIAGSVLLFTDASDTLFLSREGARTVEMTVESAQIVGQDSYVPRMEIVAQDGRTYTLLKSQVGGMMEAVADALQPGDEIILRLSRKVNILEVQEDDLIHLDFSAAKRRAGWDVFVGAGTGIVFDLLAAILIMRCAALKPRRTKLW